MLVKKGANTRDSTAISLMRMFREGPAARNSSNHPPTLEEEEFEGTLEEEESAGLCGWVPQVRCQTHT
jgi:hypothetical protein